MGGLGMARQSGKGLHFHISPFQKISSGNFSSNGKGHRGAHQAALLIRPDGKRKQPNKERQKRLEADRKKRSHRLRRCLFLCFLPYLPFRGRAIFPVNGGMACFRFDQLPERRLQDPSLAVGFRQQAQNKQSFQHRRRPGLRETMPLQGAKRPQKISTFVLLTWRIENDAQR